MVLGGYKMFDHSKIANGFNKFSTDIGPKLASLIPSSFMDFKDFLSAAETNLDDYLHQDGVLNKVFNSLKSNKSWGSDDISSTIVKRCRENIFDQIKYIFGFDKARNFSRNSKLLMFHPFLKKDEKLFFTNY